MAEVDSVQAVNKILAALRQGGMGWIADEIESAIQAGKLVDQAKRNLSDDVSFEEIEFSDLGHNAKKKTKEELLEVAPLTDIEKLKTTLRTIQHYVVGLEKTWSRAKADIKRCIGKDNVEVQITDAFTMEKIPIFEEAFAQLCKKMDGLLNQAWPEGVEPYDLIEYGHKEVG